jgi:hypothetical protein
LILPIVGSHDGFFDGSSEKDTDGLEEDTMRSVGTKDGIIDGDDVLKVVSGTIVGL